MEKPKLLKIIHEPNPILRQRAREIDLSKWDKDELRQLADDMIATMKKAPGVGLAAPQIGQSIRLIVIEHAPVPLVLINPKIISHSWRKRAMEEGCLSVPGKYGKIKRYDSVKVQARTLGDAPFEIAAKGFLSQIFQHEIDHLNGILYIDKILRIE